MTEAAAEKPAFDRDETQKQIWAAERLLRMKRAQVDLLAFIQLNEPDPNYPDDPTRSRYQVAPHHRMLADAIQDVAAGKMMRFGNSIPPQHGKSTILSRYGVAWLLGKFPHKEIIVATYGSEFAKEIGDFVRSILKSDAFRQVFPNVHLKQGSASRSRIRTEDGGGITFVGRGEATTGRPADIFIIDDPLKDREEARSPQIIKQLHSWYASVVFSRCHVLTPIIIVHTRWAEDDLIGRLMDPDHPDHNPEKAKRWTYINIPAIIDNPKIAAALGKEVGDALWPERFPLSHLKEAEDNDRNEFSALYMGKPSPDDGAYFTRDMIQGYSSPGMLPKNLRKYGASDHAVTLKTENDENVIGCVGVDEAGDIWILPDLIFAHMEADGIVETMIDQMRRNNPLIWWAEDENIRKSFGPFLRKRQREEGVNNYVEGVPSTVDLMQRARSAQGLAALHRFHFPTFAPWWSKAEGQLLKFPNAVHDDFVSWLSLIGQGIEREVAASKKTKAANDDAAPKSGTIAWIKWQTKQQERRLVAGRRGGM